MQKLNILPRAFYAYFVAYWVGGYISLNIFPKQFMFSTVVKIIFDTSRA